MKIKPGLVLCVSAIVISYFYVDRAVVAWSQASGFRQFAILHGLTHTPQGLEYLLIALCGAALIRLWRPGYVKWQRLAIAGVISVLGTLGAKNILKIVFGRYWPDTWLNNNLSWVHNHVYGFDFFNFQDYSAFPSGHAAVTFTIMTLCWIYYPRFRALYALICFGLSFSLIALYYHFVSDVIAGAYLGSLIAVLTDRALDKVPQLRKNRLSQRLCSSAG